ncbi:MAG: hypothetical protein QOI59_4503 [Gammaproteobacteria bacterium]|jgi:hypothetical protein|nr:hypothetical protein [Gammaproteobacteria bacterium]
MRPGDGRIPPALRAALLCAWSLLPIVFINSPETAFTKTHDSTSKLSNDAAPAVLVPERFRMNHALPLRWMHAIAHLSSVGKTVLQCRNLSDHGSLRLRWSPPTLAGGRLALLQNRVLTSVVDCPVDLQTELAWKAGARSMPWQLPGGRRNRRVPTWMSIRPCNTNAFSVCYESINNFIQCAAGVLLRPGDERSWCDAQKDASSWTRGGCASDVCNNCQARVGQLSEG